MNVQHEATVRPGGSSADSGFDAFEAWKEYQGIAMHFNDLLMRLRSQALAAVAGVSAVAGVVLKADVGSEFRWNALAGVFLLLSLFWIAIWILDFRYYNRLLLGAVDALIELEAATKHSNRVNELILSTRTEAIVAEGKKPTTGRLGRENARWFFYGIVFAVLFVGLCYSVYAAGGVGAVVNRASAHSITTPANKPLQPPAPARR